MGSNDAQSGDVPWLLCGHVLRAHTRDVDSKGCVHHAAPDDPQYEFVSDKTDHVALHKGRALRRLRS